ncbi:MAG: YlmH/Sll1252 family protein [Oscillospiraceae bacterium]|nr:YlmH/Sll1252 family protein [Oscillospiraceae bacterium]
MPTEDQDAVLQAKVADAIRLAQSGRGAHFVGFLDERQAVLAARAAGQARFASYLLWGGYAGAERVCFGAFPEWMEPKPQAFPLCAATASFWVCDSLTHRDFLGALLGAGIGREVLGDILVEAGRCVFFFRSEMKSFLPAQITKVGRVGVKLTLGATEPLPPAHHYQPFSAVVASARLDCVVAACMGISRTKAQALLQSGSVQMNHMPADRADSPVEEGVLLSIHGKGRYRIDSLSQQTQKGRLRLQGRKYI